MDLPPTLGAVRLIGRVVWTRLRDTEQTFDGDRPAVYESGIEFTNLMSAQQAAPASALATLQTVQAGPDRKPSP